MGRTTRRQAKEHTHPCVRCGRDGVECDGDEQENYDGEPAVICDRYHEPGGIVNQAYLCWGCVGQDQDEALAEELAGGHV